MSRFLPTVIQPMTTRFLQLLQTEHSDVIYGVYLYGSIALGAFDENRSDIDVIVLTTRDLSDAERTRLIALHKRLTLEHPIAERLDGNYVPLAALGRLNDELPPYPYISDGHLHPAGHYDINHVTWWILKHRGIPLYGPHPADLPFTVDFDAIRRTMYDNLHTYWKNKAANPLLFLTDTWVDFAVTTLCRIHYTLTEEAITHKMHAVELALQTLPARWQPLLHEAQRIRCQTSRNSFYSSRLKRAAETRAFVHYMRETHPQPQRPVNADRLTF
jgi:predicted nucleotidyltransferase